MKHEIISKKIVLQCLYFPFLSNLSAVLQFPFTLHVLKSRETGHLSANHYCPLN